MELTDSQLTALSTLAWLVVTSVSFVGLVRWSTGEGSWTVLPGLVRGVRGWVETRDRAAHLSDRAVQFVLDAPPRSRDAADQRAEIEEL